jgi:oxygen-dependent protoporphyrinogen oxidase
MAAALPQFLEMERAPGHVTGALRRQARERAAAAPPAGQPGLSASDTGVRYSLFASFLTGMGALPEALARALGPSLRLRAPVESIEPGQPEPSQPATGPLTTGEARWRVRLRSGELCPADWLLLATPARVSARLLAGVAPAAATGLASIPHGSAAVVYLAYPRNRVLHPLDAAGFVVPRVEGRSILAATFCSSKFAGRAPEGMVLLRAFVGGALQAHLLDRDDDQLAALAQRELASLLGLRGSPLWSIVSRYPDAMPQYTLGHLARARAIHDAMKPFAGLLLVSHALDGVGIPDCVRAGEAAGDRVALSPHQTAPTGGDRHAYPRHR